MREGGWMTTIIWNVFACIGIAVVALASVAWIHLWIFRRDEGLRYNTEGNQVDAGGQK